jgi:chemotaxis protein CheD
MAAAIDVPTAGYAIAQAPDSLSTAGIGSCMAICLYSTEHRTGALLHCMLPLAGQQTPNPYLYTDTALSDVLEKLVRNGIGTAGLTAKLIGGAQMFPALQAGDQNIGQRNIREVTRLLNVIGIPIIASEVGGNRGRSLEFNLTSGTVSVSQAFAAPVRMI